MQLTFGRISVPLSDDFIDCFDFVIQSLMVAPNLYHFRDNEIVVRKDPDEDDLERIGRSLKSYKAVYELAKRRSVRGRHLERVGTRLAEIYVKDEGYWLDVEWMITKIVSENRALLDDKSRTPERFQQIVVEADELTELAKKVLDIDLDDT